MNTVYIHVDKSQLKRIKRCELGRTKSCIINITPDAFDSENANVELVLSALQYGKYLRQKKKRQHLNLKLLPEHIRIIDADEGAGNRLIGHGNRLIGHYGEGQLGGFGLVPIAMLASSIIRAIIDSKKAGSGIVSNRQIEENMVRSMHGLCDHCEGSGQSGGFLEIIAAMVPEIAKLIRNDPEYAQDYQGGAGIGDTIKNTIKNKLVPVMNYTKGVIDRSKDSLEKLKDSSVNAASSLTPDKLAELGMKALFQGRNMKDVVSEHMLYTMRNGRGIGGNPMAILSMAMQPIMELFGNVQELLNMDKAGSGFSDVVTPQVMGELIRSVGPVVSELVHIFGPSGKKKEGRGLMIV